MGKADRPRRLTRAEKIEQARLEAIELKKLQSKPWWPVKAHTEEEALQLIVSRIVNLRENKAEFDREKKHKDFKLIGKINEDESFLKEIPVEYIEKAEALVKKDEEVEREFYDKGYYGDLDDDDDDWVHPNFQPAYNHLLEHMTDEELEVEFNKQADRQGWAGEQDPINERVAADANERCNLIEAERKRRRQSNAA